MRDAEMEAEIEDFIEGFKPLTYRGMRIDGGQSAGLVEPARLVRSIKSVPAGVPGQSENTEADPVCETVGAAC